MKKNLEQNCMYCGKQLKNGICDCDSWIIYNDFDEIIDETMIKDKKLTEEEQSFLFLEELFENIKAEFDYQCPNCLGKFNQPHIIQLKGTHYYCPFCGLYMTGLSNV